MKRLITFACVLLCFVFGAKAADYDFKVNNLCYTITSPANKTVELSSYTGEDSTVVIPASVDYNGTTYSVTALGESCFDYNFIPKSITIPTSVTEIKDMAFWGCASLDSITIPNSVTKIGEGAFSRCTGLKSIKLSNALTEIGTTVFYGCSGLTELTLPNTIKTIGREAFEGCMNLTKVTLNEGLEEIGFQGFLSCANLNDINYPSTLKTIGNHAFQGCGFVNVSIPNTVTTVGDYAFQWCYFLKSLTLPDTISTLPTGLVEGCTTLTTFTIQKAIKNLKGGAFNGCTSLKAFKVEEGNTAFSIKEDVLFDKTGTQLMAYPNSKDSVYTIPEGTTSIYESAFYGSTIKKLTLASTVASIGNYAFAENAAINELHFKTATPPALGKNPFYSMSTTCTVYCPKGSLNSYKAVEDLKPFVLKEDTASGLSTNNQTDCTAVKFVKYYNLNGTEIENPISGSIIIKKTVYENGTSNCKKMTVK